LFGGESHAQIQGGARRGARQEKENKVREMKKIRLFRNMTKGNFVISWSHAVAAENHGAVEEKA